MSNDQLKNFEFGGIVISRVPTDAKQRFKDLARNSFCDDYGMTLTSILKDHEEYQKLKELFFDNKLNIKLLINEREEK